MPIIQVLVDNVDYKKILDHYNNNKPDDLFPLKRLDVFEGGFEIDIPSDKWVKSNDMFLDENDKVKQLRWSQGRLLSYGSYPRFTIKEYMLLYETLVQVLPPGKVLLLE